MDLASAQGTDNASLKGKEKRGNFFKMPPKQQQPKQKPTPSPQQNANGQQEQSQGNGEQEQEGEFQPAYTEEEQHRERSKAASQSLEAKKKARYYIRAAAGAGDSKERQRLLKEALNKEVEAESFGKLAKWLNSGALQGFAAGSIPAVSLGALTGTLVGGVTSLITGGLGAGIGWLKGPAYSVGGVAASGLKKLTGDYLEWNPDATEEQQQALEHMCGQIQDEDMPEDDELEMFSAGEWSTGDGIKQGLNEMHDGRGKPTQSWSSYAASWVPGQQAMESIPGYSRLKGSGQDQRSLQNQRAQQSGAPKSEAAAKSKAQGARGRSEATNAKELSRSHQMNSAAKDVQERVRPAVQNTAQQRQPNGTSGGAAKIRQPSKAKSARAAANGPSSTSTAPKQTPATSSQASTPRPKGKPRKLEVRSQ